MMAGIQVFEVSGDALEGYLEPLSGILQHVVEDAGSVGFVLPFELEAAERYWQQDVFPAIRAGEGVMFLALVDGALAGTVQLRHGLLPNQTHRSDVSKLLVDPQYRRRGLGRQLMMALEDRARRLGKRLLTLDTRSGDVAEPLYLGLGYEIAGSIPLYARAPDGSDRFDATTYMYKVL